MEARSCRVCLVTPCQSQLVPVAPTRIRGRSFAVDDYTVAYEVDLIRLAMHCRIRLATNLSVVQVEVGLAVADPAKRLVTGTNAGIASIADTRPDLGIPASSCST